jgi:thiamine-phosphate pyrophosphorylase
VDVVQLRDKNLEARQLLIRAALAAEVCAQFDVPFILNDRPDLALACSASGVHVGQDDIPPEVAREILGTEAIVGLSTHRPSEWDAATESSPASAAVDYLSAGPVNETPTKPGRPATGLSYLEYVASTPTGSTGGIPWFVTGGVTPQTVPDMAAAGARRFVVVRYLTESEEPQSAAGRLRAVIHRSTGG